MIRGRGFEEKGRKTELLNLKWSSVIYRKTDASTCQESEKKE